MCAVYLINSFRSRLPTIVINNPFQTVYINYSMKKNYYAIIDNNKSEEKTIKPGENYI